jgi:hypothetical protein
MYDFENVALSKMIVHRVGNKQKEEGIDLSHDLLHLDETILPLLLKYFLAPFKTDAFYNFVHEQELNLNEMWFYASEIFKNPDSFHLQSTNMAKHLYEKTVHPNINSGELFIVYFSECVVDGESVDAIGIFKSETKTTFLKVFPQGDNFSIESNNGININKLDKGCLIFNTEKDLGYKLCVVDNVNKSQEAQYWVNDFLGAELRKNDFYKTQTYMKACKGFVEEVFNEENNVDKSAQIELMNKSVSFFKENDTFDEERFKTEVLYDEKVITAFDDYKQTYEEENNLQLPQEFDISDTAVKQEQKQFKSVLKLDRNFSVYIHGNRNYLERGFDQDTGLNYYKLFYEKEK